MTDKPTAAQLAAEEIWQHGLTRKLVAAIITKHFPTGPSLNQAIGIVERYRDEMQRAAYDYKGEGIKADVKSRHYYQAAHELLTQLRAASDATQPEPSLADAVREVERLARQAERDSNKAGAYDLQAGAELKIQAETCKSIAKHLKALQPVDQPHKEAK